MALMPPCKVRHHLTEETRTNVSAPEIDFKAVNIVNIMNYISPGISLIYKHKEY